MRERGGDRLPGDDTVGGATNRIEPAEQAVIDEALQLVSAGCDRLAASLYSHSSAPIALNELREGPLGNELAQLARLATGTRSADCEHARDAIQAVLRLLFRPADTTPVSVPVPFWATPLGRMLSLARLRSCESDALVTVTEAATRLGVARPTVYRWLEHGELDAVRDDLNGRIYAVRDDIEAVAARLAGERATKGEAKAAADTATGNTSQEAPDVAGMVTGAGRREADGEAAAEETERGERRGQAGDVGPLAAAPGTAPVEELAALRTALRLVREGRVADLIGANRDAEHRGALEAREDSGEPRGPGSQELLDDPEVEIVAEVQRAAVEAIALIRRGWDTRDREDATREGVLLLRVRTAKAAMTDGARDRWQIGGRARADLQRARLDLEFHQITARRERLAREREFLEVLPDLARRLVDLLHPGGIDPAQRALLAQGLLPSLARLGQPGGMPTVRTVGAEPDEESAGLRQGRADTGELAGER